MVSLHPKSFFDLSSSIVADIFDGVDTVWAMLPRIRDIVYQLIGSESVVNGTIMPGAHVSDELIYIGEGAVIEPGCYVQGPAYIGPGTVLRHAAYVRGNVILLEGSILGHASEAKNALFLPGARAPHFAYVGDSILGHRVNLGAGAKLSNVPVVSGFNAEAGTRSTIKLSVDGSTVDTGLTKFGAILGDRVQIGCNAVLNPGTIVGPDSVVYANATVPKGVHPQRTITKLRQHQVKAQLRIE